MDFPVKVNAFWTMTVDQMWIVDMIQMNLKGKYSKVASINKS